MVRVSRPGAAAKARLYTSVVEDAGWPRRFRARFSTPDPFLYSVSFTATQGVALAAVEEAALAEIDRVRQSGVTPAETARALRQLKARLVFETDSVTNIAHQLGYFETVAGPGVFQDVQRRIQQVTAEQVSDVARRRLDPTQRTVGWFRPQDPAVSAPTLARGLSPARSVLPNNVVAIAQQNVAAPAVAISLAFRAGSIHDPASLPGLSYLMSLVVDRGTSHRSADAIAETLDDRGISLRVAVTRHSFTLGCTCLTEDFPICSR